MSHSGSCKSARAIRFEWCVVFMWMVWLRNDRWNRYLDQGPDADACLTKLLWGVTGRLSDSRIRLD